MRKALKRFLVGALTASMALGMLSGMGMNVRASGDGSDTPQSGQNANMGFDISTDGDRKGFDVWGVTNGSKAVKTTYNYRGYETQMQVGDNPKVVLKNGDGSSSIFTLGKEYEDHGVKASVVASLTDDAVVLTYNVTNTTDEDLVVKIGSWADTQIGDNDRAPIYFLGNAIVMEEKDDKTGRKFAIISGNGDFTTRWIGDFHDASKNIFNNSEATEYAGNTLDSGIAYSWTLNVPAHSSVSTSSAPATGDLKLVTVSYNSSDSEGTMVATTAIKGDSTKMTLSKNAYTKENNYFMGWATSAEDAANKIVTYSDNQEIDVPAENMTLYAVWEPYRDQVIALDDTEIKYGESGKLDASADGEGEISFKLDPDDENASNIIELDEKTGEIKAKKVGETTVIVTAGARLYYNETVKKVKVTVSPVEKKDLETAIKDAQDYYDSIKDDYKEIAEKLFDSIDEAEETVAEANVNSDEVSEVYKAIQDALTEAKAAVKDIEDTEAAKKVEEAISKLPAADKVTEADKEAVEAARKAYDDLTDDQKKKVSEEVLKKLTGSEDKIKSIQEEAAKNKEENKENNTEENKEENSKPSNEWINGQWYDADGNATYEPKGEWKCNSTGWWYEDSSGWYPYSQWQKIDGKWYYFLDNGYLDYSEYRDGYWLGSDGALVDGYYGQWKSDATGWWFEDESGWYPTSQWLWINGSCYYFEASGYIAVSKYVDGYWVGADGAYK